MNLVHDMDSISIIVEHREFCTASTDTYGPEAHSVDNNDSICLQSTPKRLPCRKSVLNPYAHAQKDDERNTNA